MASRKPFVIPLSFRVVFLSVAAVLSVIGGIGWLIGRAHFEVVLYYGVGFAALSVSNNIWAGLRVFFAAGRMALLAALKHDEPKSADEQHTAHPTPNPRRG